MQAGGGRVSVAAADLSDHAGLLRAVASILERTGGIDILVNNSGGPPPTCAAGVPANIWREQFEAIALSAISLTDAILPGMRANKWGRILTIASSGVIEPHAHIGLSNALRSSLVGWSKTLAAEVAADGITVNMLIPGFIATDRLRAIDQHTAKTQNIELDEFAAVNAARIPVGRYGSIEEFGAVAAFLASDLASYVTGTMQRVDGGAIRSV
jgi:3-oxoacyl-[acyl-carrier protein] reductase